MPKSGRSGAAHWWRKRYTLGRYLLRHWLRLVHARRLRWPRLAAMVLARWWWWCGFWHRWHRRRLAAADARR